MVEVSPIQRVCVYCGSGAGENPAYAVAARQLGTILADNGIGLVYGGGCIGLMGEVARAVLEAGGHVTGIIPGFLTEREIMLKDVQDLIVVEGMHERKHLMFDKSDAFVALPGGIGTLEELVEQLTWAQLGRHEKPVVLANIEGFWDPLLRLFAHMQENSFIRRDAALKLAVIDQVQDILPAIEKHMRPRAEEAEAEAIDIKF